MIIEAHRLMHEDGGIGEIEHVSMHMDSQTRELLSETGAYPLADPRWSRRSRHGRVPRRPEAGMGRPSSRICWAWHSG